MRRTDLTDIARIIVTVALGGIGAAAGFTHTHDWANAHWQHGWLAWADAVVIEGLAIVAGFEVHRDHQAGRRGRAALIPQAVLVAAFLIQMTAQVSQAEPTPAGWLLAAMPALGFLTVVKLVMRRMPARTAQPAAPSEPPTRQATALRTDPPVTPPAPPAPPARPALTMTTRLPASIRNTITDLTSKARQEGRQITIEEIRRTITLPDTMLTQLVAELNTTLNPEGATSS
ncbi:MAG TPA: DUF2637 domain-containing protein [Pseudonocardiaceae bacterium]|jgi:hypothetical protein|nr:DUF2637 domain-containing protein [Pseudonocardiaceae bacterium]